MIFGENLSICCALPYRQNDKSRESGDFFLMKLLQLFSKKINLFIHLLNKKKLVKRFISNFHRFHLTCVSNSMLKFSLSLKKVLLVMFKSNRTSALTLALVLSKMYVMNQ